MGGYFIKLWLKETGNCDLVGKSFGVLKVFLKFFCKFLETVGTGLDLVVKFVGHLRNTSLD